MEDVIMYNVIFTLGLFMYLVLLGIGFSKDRITKNNVISNILIILCALLPLLIIDTYQAGLAGDLLTGGFVEVAIFGIFNIPMIIACLGAVIIVVLKHLINVVKSTRQSL